MGTRTTLQPVFESVKTDHTGTVHGSVPHRHSSSKVSFYVHLVVNLLQWLVFRKRDFPRLEP